MMYNIIIISIIAVIYLGSSLNQLKIAIFTKIYHDPSTSIIITSYKCRWWKRGSCRVGRILGPPPSSEKLRATLRHSNILYFPSTFLHTSFLNNLHIYIPSSYLFAHSYVVLLLSIQLPLSSVHLLFYFYCLFMRSDLLIYSLHLRSSVTVFSFKDLFSERIIVGPQEV